MKKFTKVSVLTLAIVMLLSVSLTATAFTPPTNLLPADLLTSADKADDYFTNVSTNAADYSYEDAEYIMRVPESAKNTNWIATKDEITYTSYTISLDIRPVDYVSGSTTKTGGASILLGTNANNAAFPWHCIRFNFSSAEGTASFFGYEHKGGSYGYMDPSYTVVKSGVDFEEHEWFNLTVEVTAEGSKIYLDGELLKEEWNERLPGSADIKWVGLYPEGSTDGFDAKNFQITDKATSAKLLPEDLFTAAKASTHLTKVDAATCTVEGSVPMMRVPIVSNSNAWVYSPLPSMESYTLSVDVMPLLKADGSTYGGTGILLGTGANNSFPWFNLQFNYANGKVTVYLVEHNGSLGYGYLKNYTDAPILTGVDFTTKKWFNITIEVTAEGTAVYVDDVAIPADAMDHLPTSEDIKYVGLYPSGGSNGYWVKNLALYEGVDLVFEEPSPSPTPSETPSATVAPTEAPTATPGAQNKPTGDASMMAIVALILAVGAGFIVLRKKACRE